MARTYLIARESDNFKILVLVFVVQSLETLVLGSEPTISEC